MSPVFFTDNLGTDQDERDARAHIRKGIASVMSFDSRMFRKTAPNEIPKVVGFHTF